MHSLYYKTVKTPAIISLGKYIINEEQYNY